MPDRDLQDRVAKFVVGGAMLSLVSLIVMLPGLGGGALLRELGGPPTLMAIGVIAFLGIVAGFVLMGIGIAIGVRRVTKKHVGSERFVPGAYIVSVTCEDSRGQLVSDPSLHDAHELRYYARVRFPEGHVDEFKVAPTVLDGLGEGMTGTVGVLGDRVVRFSQDRPDMADPSPHNRP
ncbi:MAG: hypothetical protein IT207_04905 [Fimbriimonadaceae bacterium]|nr:hypothetical protein [Fimbriimonadaceae bacterium]